MGGSAKPRRRRAAAPALHYDRQPGRPGSSGQTLREKLREFGFGCLVLLCMAGVGVALVTVNMLWGDDTWQWAAESWPGGAYGFAAAVGACGPCLVLLLIISLSHMDRESWRTHTARTLAHTVLSVTSATALVPYVCLIFNSQDNGKWGRGRGTSPSWVYAHYPWLWAVGLLSTVATITALIRIFIALHRRRSPLGGNNRPSSTGTELTGTDIGQCKGLLRVAALVA
jgi:hypothetical protein